jgi:hypothetical protein
MILKKELYEENKLLKSRNIMLQDELFKYYHVVLYLRDYEILENGTLFLSVKIEGSINGDEITKQIFKNDEIYINNIKYKKFEEQPQLDIKVSKYE